MVKKICLKFEDVLRALHYNRMVSIRWSGLFKVLVHTRPHAHLPTGSFKRRTHKVAKVLSPMTGISTARQGHPTSFLIFL